MNNILIVLSGMIGIMSSIGCAMNGNNLQDLFSEVIKTRLQMQEELSEHLVVQNRIDTITCEQFMRGAYSWEFTLTYSWKFALWYGSYLTDTLERQTLDFDCALRVLRNAAKLEQHRNHKKHTYSVLSAVVVSKFSLPVRRNRIKSLSGFGFSPSEQDKDMALLDWYERKNDIIKRWTTFYQSELPLDLVRVIAYSLVKDLCIGEDRPLLQ